MFQHTQDTADNILICISYIKNKRDELCFAVSDRKKQPEVFIRLTARFHQIRVHCATAPIRFCSAVRRLPADGFGVATAQCCRTARPRSSCGNHRITRCSYRPVL